MFEFAALTYGVLASFIMASVSRNKREERRNPPILTLFAWLFAAFSLSSALMLIGYVGWRALSGSAA
jgi:membrane glycosyltransferase